MRCLVSGGAGFIGSNLVDALIEQGHEVSILDDLSTGRRENLAGALREGATLQVSDIRDAPSVRAVMEKARPEVVFHLAAQIDVRHSVARPADDAATNVLGTITLLTAAQAEGVRRFVNSSSGGAVYGDTDVLPTPETHAPSPMSPYGQSKYAAEGYVDLYARLSSVSAVSLRYSNVYGPRQDPHGEGGVAAIFCGCLAEGRRPIVFGDGHQTRDWVEVSDVVRANLLAAESAVRGPINIGTGHETRVLDLIAVLNEVSDRGELQEPEFAPERPGEVRRSLLDVRRAGDELGWSAQMDLPDGLRRILQGM
ncbi:MAG TPA: NAD-dependent epimerase/dehydratase family protein [Solirubrobacteraceae bacterium]|nr:NAD-dependent epimerase/dehydratase family protein [Solirubrobacteraceae bacterium]